MIKEIYVNLPVKDLQKSIAFFEKLGFTFNPQFTDEKATCMLIGENIFAMLLTEAFFSTFTKKAIADSSKTTEAILCIATDSRQSVDKMIQDARNAGGKIPNDSQDHGWMYIQGFEDLDGHLWEVMYADASAIPQT